MTDTVYRASDATRRVYYSDLGTGVTQSKRVGHRIRNGYTLCGRTASSFAWVEPDTSTIACHLCASVPDGWGLSADFRAAGLTYRQVDFWISRGWLRPSETQPGRGRRRLFPPSELAVGRMMARLTAAGVEPSAAHRVARGGELAPGIRVEVTS